MMPVAVLILLRLGVMSPRLSADAPLDGGRPTDETAVSCGERLLYLTLADWIRESTSDSFFLLKSCWLVVEGVVEDMRGCEAGEAQGLGLTGGWLLLAEVEGEAEGEEEGFGLEEVRVERGPRPWLGLGTPYTVAEAVVAVE